MPAIINIEQRIAAAQAAADLLAAHASYKSVWQGETMFNDMAKNTIKDMLTIARGNTPS